MVLSQNAVSVFIFIIFFLFLFCMMVMISSVLCLLNISHFLPSLSGGNLFTDCMIMVASL